MRRLLVIALVLVLAGSASGFVVPSPVHDTLRVIPSDPRLPAYNNPFEADMEEGMLHLSFVGAFQYFEKGAPGETVDFYFTATAKNDMQITIDSGEFFDSKGRRYRHDWWHEIGYERTSKREIIAGVPVLIKFVYRVARPSPDALPSVARVRFCFNNSWLEFRNIKLETWDTWLQVSQELGL
ncbi:MAG: hypothetical protein IJS28_05870 [Synergistaceae bacterium]|nr:hypothetical protein [Synergistaceae bacterium]